MSEQPGRERFVLTFEALPDPDSVPVAIRLRALLKYAGRGQHLRCLKVEQLQPDAGAPPASAPPVADGQDATGAKE